MNGLYSAAEYRTQQLGPSPERRRLEEVPQTGPVPVGLARLARDLPALVGVGRGCADPFIEARDRPARRAADAHNHRKVAPFPERLQEAGIDQARFADPGAGEQQDQPLGQRQL